MAASADPVASSNVDSVVSLTQFLRNHLDTSVVPQWRAITQEGWLAFLKEFHVYRSSGGTKSIRAGLSEEALSLVFHQDPSLEPLIGMDACASVHDCSLDVRVRQAISNFLTPVNTQVLLDNLANVKMGKTASFTSLLAYGNKFQKLCPYGRVDEKQRAKLYIRGLATTDQLQARVRRLAEVHDRTAENAGGSFLSGSE